MSKLHLAILKRTDLPFREIVPVFFVVLFLVGSVAADERGRSAQAKKPNVLFISIDDLNDWIEPLGGHPQAKTPHLVRFAKRSVNFANAHCPSPGCNPSRTAIMTGLAPYRSGVYSNYQDWRELIKDPQTIGSRFRKAGYHSAGAGKIFHYHMVDPSCWDEYWPSQQKNMPNELMPDKSKSRLATDEIPRPRTMNMPMFEYMYGMFDWHAMNVKDSQMADYKSVDYVIKQLNNKDRDQPFFLACGIYRPHLPWYVPKKYFDQYPLETLQLPKLKQDDLDDVGDRVRDIASRGGGYHRHVVEAKQWKPAVQGYLASITFADAMLGRLLDALDASGHADNTIVVVWSDHGWQLGEKQHWRKFALWENVVRSVLMIHVPRGIASLPDGSKDGVVCQRPVSLQDIYPTLVDLCGLSNDKRIDGNSLKPLLRDPKSDWKHVAITTYDFGEFSIRDQRYRYTIYIDGSEELYDHRNDREEWNNVANHRDYINIKRSLAAKVPKNPAPLLRTSQKLQAHHIPPFRSRDDYQEWLRNGKDNRYLIKKYWQ